MEGVGSIPTVSTMNKLLITGSRKAGSRLLWLSWELISTLNKDEWEVIVGDAPGIDANVIRACDYHGIKVTVYGAYGKMRNKTVNGENIATKGSYPGRDKIMAGKCNQCVAFWDGESKGTKITFEAARKKIGNLNVSVVQVPS